ncbi:MAG: 4-hydroxyphenylalkanoate adenylyltransferase [Myxococcota bacterium]|nr:4-hydroxyphenylalkanoate adenylyltransferase [Myxococcota bacterium]
MTVQRVVVFVRNLLENTSMSQFADFVQVIDALQNLPADRGYTFLDQKLNPTFVSFAQLRAEAFRRARYLREGYGVNKGDRVAMIIPNGDEFVPTFLAIVSLGAIPVPLYPPLAMGRLDSYIDSLTRIMVSSSPKLLVTTQKASTVLWSVAPKVQGLKNLVTCEEFAKAGKEAISSPAQVKPDDICFLQYTSGSTSDPKGVMVTHGNLVANCKAIAWDGLKLQPEDSALSWLPLYHDMGLIGFVLTPLLGDVPVTFLETLTFVKDASVWMKTMSRIQASIAFAPNFAYALSVKRTKPEVVQTLDLSRVRVLGCGAEPIHVDTMARFLDHFSPAGLKRQSILPCYGMAEATLAISFIGLDEEVSAETLDADEVHERQVAKLYEPNGVEKSFIEVVNCGRIFPGHGLKIVNDNGEELPERHIGEIIVSGPSVSPGYFQNPEATAKSFRDGWLYTGDLGYVAGGQVFITGRKKDVIIINGRNYFPQSIEWICNEVPGVRPGSAVAFSRPGAISEELVVACETRESDHEPLRREIVRRVNEQLQLGVADVVFVEPGALPKTSSGKVQRARTRQQYLDRVIGSQGVRTIGGTADNLVVAKHVGKSLLGKVRHKASQIVEKPISKIFRKDEAEV